MRQQVHQRGVQMLYICWVFSGWDKVEQLTRALVDLGGLSVMNEQARSIRQLYHQLHDDKKPLSYTPVKQV